MFSPRLIPLPKLEADLDLSKVRTRPTRGLLLYIVLFMSTLPTSGRVLVQTTVGDIEIELWARVRHELLLQFSKLTFKFRKRPWHVVILSLWR